MGRAIIEACRQAEGVELGAALVRPGSSVIGVDAGELAGVGHLGVAVADSLTAVSGDFDVLIDFTRPEVTLTNLAACRQAGKAMIIGTTGFDEAQRGQIAAAAREIAIVFAPNMSVGVNLCLKLLDLAARVLGGPGAPRRLPRRPPRPRRCPSCCRRSTARRCRRSPRRHPPWRPCRP